VFHNEGERIKDFRGAWKAACTKANIQGKLFRDLRRTGVRNNVGPVFFERVAMTIREHKSRCMFERYDIVGEKHLEEAATRQQADLGSLAGGISGTAGRNAPIRAPGKRHKLLKSDNMREWRNWQTHWT
jgi:hypothetical protein